MAGLTAEQRASRAAYMRAYRRQNPELFRRIERSRHERHGDERRLRNRIAYQQNREARLERNRKWRIENRDQHLARRRAIRERLKQNPAWRVAKAISSSMLQALRNKKEGARWESILGYTRIDLVTHLERQFNPKMSWQNFGSVWVIDHIRPISSFEFSSIDDPAVKDCWGLTNLRPLSKIANLRKHAQRTHLV